MASDTNQSFTYSFVTCLDSLSLAHFDVPSTWPTTEVVLNRLQRYEWMTIRKTRISQRPITACSSGGTFKVEWKLSDLRPMGWPCYWPWAVAWALRPGGWARTHNSISSGSHSPKCLTSFSFTLFGRIVQDVWVLGCFATWWMPLTWAECLRNVQNWEEKRSPICLQQWGYFWILAESVSLFDPGAPRELLLLQMATH